MKTEQYTTEVQKFYKAINKIAPVIHTMVNNAIDNNDIANVKSLKAKFIKAIETKVRELIKLKWLSAYLIEPNEHGGSLILKFRYSHIYDTGKDYQGAEYFDHTYYLAYVSTNWQTGTIEAVKKQNPCRYNEVTPEQYKSKTNKCKKLNQKMIDLQKEIDEINETLNSETRYKVQTYRV